MIHIYKYQMITNLIVWFIEWKINREHVGKSFYSCTQFAIKKQQKYLTHTLRFLIPYHKP
jgi:hypothetical protein